MTYSASHIILSELRDRDKLSPSTRAYFRQRQRNRLHNLVLKKFREASNESGLTRAKLARRMGRAPEAITRLLQSPGNWRLDTLSDMLLAIAGEEIDDSSTSPVHRPKRNYSPSTGASPKDAITRINKDIKPSLIAQNKGIENIHKQLNKNFEPA